MSTTNANVTPDLICATRALKNARHIQSVAPQVFPAVEPSEGFASVVPFDVLNRFHQMSDQELSAHPHLLDAAKKLRQKSQPVSAPAGIGPISPLFKGTVHIAKVTFNDGANQRAFSDTDMSTTVQYLRTAAPAILEYCKQYGDCRLAIAPNFLRLTVDVHNGKYNDDNLRTFVKRLVSQNNLSHSGTCIVVFNPPGVVNTDGDASKGVGGYHDAVDGIPYCFCNTGGTGFTVQDRPNRYVETLSHEVAEMLVDPLISFLSPEVCDPCAGNCHFRWLSFFTTDPAGAPHYLSSARNFPALPFNPDFFVAAVAKPGNVNQCPPGESGCNYAPPGDKVAPGQLKVATGKLAFLRVHRLGSGFGPPSDFIDVEVVIGIKGATGAFGFTIRDDDKQFAHHGMLDLLRDAHKADSVVEVEYDLPNVEVGQTNGIILRVTRRK